MSDYRTPTPWKKTQEGRIVYDRPRKSWNYRDLIRIVRSISLGTDQRKGLSFEDLLQFLLDFLSLIISDVISSVLTKALATLIVQMVRAVTVVGLARIARVVALFGSIAALVEFIEAQDPFNKTSEPLA